MEFKEGTRVRVSVRALYNMEDDLLYGQIIPDFAKLPNDTDYYDLYNEDGELACLDGEEVVIAQVGQHLVTLRNDNGDGSVYFTLTHEEATVALSS